MLQCEPKLNLKCLTFQAVEKTENEKINLLVVIDSVTALRYQFYKRDKQSGLSMKNTFK